MKEGEQVTYLKIVLTIIAVLLTLHLIKPVLISKAQAGPEVLDVNIVRVGSRGNYDRIVISDSVNWDRVTWVG